MENARFLECLRADFSRIREVVPGHLEARVPTCPDWTVADLVRHVAEVYLHKVEMMRHGAHPEGWPPASFLEEEPVGLLTRGYGELRAEFDARKPEDTSKTWYEPDQTVGFWVRRMAQETVIHRVDAELGARAQVTAIPGDLAADGIDELLVAFVQYGTTNWPEEFAELLKPAGDRLVSVVTPERSWALRLTSRDVRVDEAAAGTPAAVVEGPAADVLLWLWARGGESAAASGDEDTVALLRKVLVASTQ